MTSTDTTTGGRFPLPAIHKGNVPAVGMLARLADCADPDRYGYSTGDGPTTWDRDLASPGARFLMDVATDTQDVAREIADDFDPGDTLADHYDLSDLAHDIADQAVPVYTYEKWRTFTDLAAWLEDLDELGGTCGDMDKDSNVALYLIGCRLASALLEAWNEDPEEAP